VETEGTGFISLYVSGEWIKSPIVRNDYRGFFLPVLSTSVWTSERFTGRKMTSSGVADVESDSSYIGDDATDTLGFFPCRMLSRTCYP
jgi:hypothetical protein